ncbi:MAG: TetR family transcriptional regulator [Alphaproteobacteria bacterium]|nr:TetR family transcriptional regulator [Alphaproteobacteria bacterium]
MKQPSSARAATPEPQRKSDITRQAILDSAARAFRLSGYSGARLSDIAAGAGMQAGSLYYHFDSREALVEALMDRGVEQTEAAVRAAIAALPAPASARDRLRAAIETHLLMIVQQEDIASATIKLIWQVPQPIRERALGRQRAYGALWRKLLADARDAGEIRSDLDLSVVRMSIMGALNWAADWYKPGKMTPEAIAADIVAMTLEGLRGPCKGEG